MEHIKLFKKFVDYGIENKNELTKYYFLSILVALLELSGVALIYPFIFSITNNNSGMTMKNCLLGALIVGLFLSKNLFMIYYTKLQIDFVQKCELFISKKFMKYFLLGKYQDTYKISFAQKGHILNYIVPNCLNNYLLRLLNLSINILIFVLISSFLFIKFFTASVITIICASVILFLEIKFFQYKTRNLTQVLKDINLKIGQFLNNAMLNVKTIKINNSEGLFFDKYAELQDKKIKYNSSLQFYNLIAPYITEPLIIILLFILLAIISLQNLDKTATLIASYALIASAIFRLAPSINRIQVNVTGIKNNMPILNDFFKYYDLYNIKGVENISADKNKIEFNKSIEFKDLSFAYDEKLVLDNINLTINKGEFIGIAGLSGVGKTTLVDIISGLFKPQSGKISIDEIDYGLEIPSLKIGYIPQDFGIISATIRENVAFGQDKIDDNRVIEVLKMAQIYDYIVENFKDGINANPFVDSTGLSQGQKQRLAIARALYTDPDILILDEATSALDLKTEEEFCEVLKSLKGEKTIIAIAHRLSTIRFADKIVFMENGKIPDIAPFEELMNRNRFFKEYINITLDGK